MPIDLPRHAVIEAYLNKIYAPLPDDKLDVDVYKNFCEHQKAFSIEVTQLRQMAKLFHDEIISGLEQFKQKKLHHKKTELVSQICCFKMLDSAVTDLPTGKEKGVYYALDFGGTNFRAVRGILKGDSQMILEQYKLPLYGENDPTTWVIKNLPKGLLDKNATATQLFNFFALVCKQLMNLVGDLDSDTSNASTRQGCFTFSFPCNQQTIDSATLVEWTKGFETGRNTADIIENKDVVLLTQQAFERNQIPMKITAMISDTVGTLLSCSYDLEEMLHPKCMVGLILGTGVNACYVEPDALKYGYVGRIINLECGNFCRNLPRTSIDIQVDIEDESNIGKQYLEKMVSGAYLGEIARMSIVHILGPLSPSQALVKHSFKTKYVCRIAVDTSETLLETKTILQDVLKADDTLISKNSLVRAIQKTCGLIFIRSARLATIIIAGIHHKIKCPFSVGIDGALYKFNKMYHALLEYTLVEIFGSDILKTIHLVLSDDGSGKGAVILAATLNRDT